MPLIFFLNAIKSIFFAISICRRLITKRIARLLTTRSAKNVIKKKEIGKRKSKKEFSSYVIRDIFFLLCSYLANWTVWRSHMSRPRGFDRRIMIHRGKGYGSVIIGPLKIFILLWISSIHARSTLYQWLRDFSIQQSVKGVDTSRK